MLLPYNELLHRSTYFSSFLSFYLIFLLCGLVQDLKTQLCNLMITWSSLAQVTYSTLVWFWWNCRTFIGRTFSSWSSSIYAILSSRHRSNLSLTWMRRKRLMEKENKSVFTTGFSSILMDHQMRKAVLINSNNGTFSHLSKVCKTMSCNSSECLCIYAEFPGFEAHGVN